MSIYFTVAALVLAVGVIVADFLPDPRDFVQIRDTADDTDRCERTP